MREAVLSACEKTGSKVVYSAKALAMPGHHTSSYNSKASSACAISSEKAQIFRKSCAQACQTPCTRSQHAATPHARPTARARCKCCMHTQTYACAHALRTTQPLAFRKPNPRSRPGLYIQRSLLLVASKNSPGVTSNSCARAPPCKAFATAQ